MTDNNNNNRNEEERGEDRNNNIDTGHKTVHVDLTSLKEYHSNNDHESLKNALKTTVTAMKKHDAGVWIFSPSSLTALRFRWFHKYLLSPVYKLAPGLETWAARRSFGNFVIERETGEKIWEGMPIYTRIGMHLIFSGKVEEEVVELKTVKNIFNAETKRLGAYFDSPHSVHNIPKFVKQYNIDLNELLVPDINKYKTFNEFFYRKLKPGLRPIDSVNDNNIYTSPADSRAVFYKNIDLAKKYWVKGKKFTIGNLLNDEELAKCFEGGSIAIFRLAPQDYHRFNSPIAGKVIKIKSINGDYLTVNPMAINEELDVLTENARSLILLEPTTSTASKTKLAFIAVGALLVGSIRYSINENDEVNKGDELGHFAYGGSTIIVLWEKKAQIKFDEDLTGNSTDKLETLVKLGMRIGQST